MRTFISECMDAFDSCGRNVKFHCQQETQKMGGGRGGVSDLATVHVHVRVQT